MLKDETCLVSNSFDNEKNISTISAMNGNTSYYGYLIKYGLLVSLVYSNIICVTCKTHLLNHIKMKTTRHKFHASKARFWISLH